MLKTFKIFIILGIFIIFSGCQPWSASPTPTTVPVKKPTEEITAVKPLIFASIPMDNRLKMLDGWTLLAEFITEETGIPIEVNIKKSYYEIIEALANNEIDFCFCGPLVYVEAHDKAGALPLVKPTANGEPFYNCVIIVRKDSGIEKLEDLKGKKFAFTDRESTSGYLFPRAMLAEEGITSLKFFSETIFTGGHDSSFQGVYQNYIDGAGIFDYAFVREPDPLPEVKELKIIKKSDPIPMGPITINKNLDKEVAEKLKKALLKVGKTEETKIIAEKIKVDGYVEAQDSDYDSIRKALKIVDSLSDE